jgi:DNA polymerase-3 subunit chi
MPPRIDFYVSEEAGAEVRLRLACRVTEKAYLAKQKVVVLLDDPEALRRFDELLWTFGDGSFVPHDAIDAADESCAAPVALTAGPLPADHNDVLVNLAATVPEGFERFARVAEFLDARPEVRAAGRERFKAYRSHSIEPQTHKLGSS